MRSGRLILVMTIIAALCPFMAQAADSSAEAMTKLREAAEKGDAKAQHDLAVDYMIGSGVPKDKAEVVKWLTRSAEQGNANSESLLGTLYFQGDGVEQDITEAIKWWYMAVEKHDSSAESQLGFAYLLGDGVPVNFTQAYMWFSLAISDGDKHAVKDRDTIAKRMTPDHIVEAQHAIAEWLQKHPNGS